MFIVTKNNIMKKLKRTLGIVILASVLIGLFVFTAVDAGMVEAIIAWGVSIGIVILIAVAAFLITEG